RLRRPVRDRARVPRARGRAPSLAVGACARLALQRRGEPRPREGRRPGHRDQGDRLSARRGLVHSDVRRAAPLGEPGYDLPGPLAARAGRGRRERATGRPDWMIPLETLRAAPKVLLHDHLDGGLRPRTVIDLAREVGYTGLPTMDPLELGRWFHASAASGSLALYLRGFAHTIAGEEAGHPPKAHLAAFEYCRRENFNITIHAGEGFGPPSIWQALQYCGAHRIGHGVRLVEDMALADGRVVKLGPLATYVRDKRIPLELCPSSNVDTGAVPSLEEHPIRHFIAQRFRVTVNTDNRLMSNVTL